MKTVSAIAQYLAGLIFLVFGLNGFLHFIPLLVVTLFWALIFVDVRSAFTGLFQWRFQPRA
jgi:hypothetical protein